MRYLTGLFVSLVLMLASEGLSLASTAVIGSIKIAPGGSRIEIQGDQPLTYLYRKMTGGSGIMLDIAPGKAKGIVGEIPGAGNVTGIWVKELQVDGIPVTRLVIGMEKDAAVNVNRDTSDAGRILVTFPSLASSDSTVPGEPVLSDIIEPQLKPVKGGSDPEKAGLQELKNADTPTVQSIPSAAPDLKPAIKTAPLTVAAPVASSPLPVVASSPLAQAKPVLESVVVNRDTIELITGTAMPSYDSFRLSSPNRLVIDLPGAGSSLKSRDIKVGKFGVSKARIGVYGDKVRVVFDVESKDGVPMHVIQKTAKGLKVTFATK